MIMKYAALVLVSTALCRLYAQTSMASLVGVAKDPSGALVAGAKVEIRNVNTNGMRKAESDSKGEFIVPNLMPGVYDIFIVRDGFQTLRQTGLELQVDQEARLEFHLELGTMSQTVSIQASVPLINTENSVKGEVMVSDEILQMPLISRAVTDLAYLTPGVVQNTSGVGGASSSPMAVNGARADNSNFIIDGFNARDFRDAGLQVAPSLDALQEFKMQVSGYSADTGRQAGGVMTMVLKTGGNQLHGSLFEYLRNNALNARNFFDGASPSTLRRNQYGATLSGPVFIPKLYHGKDRTFFLFSWEGNRQNSPTPVLSAVPTLAQRQGDFSALPAIKNPLSTPANAVFPNNQIPLSLQNPVALKVQAFIPLPNSPGTNNFFADAPNPGGTDSFVAKIDQRVTQAGNLSFKFLTNRSHSVGPYNGGNTGLFGNFGWSHNTLAGLTYTQTFTPQVVNEFRFGVSRTLAHYQGVHAGTNYNEQLGLPGPTDPGVIGFPEFLISGYAQIGDAPGWPNTYTSTSYNTSDTLTWVKGPHLIKFGADILRSQWFETTSTGERGIFQFTGIWTGQPYADFLMGLLNGDQREVSWSTDYFFGTSYGAFVQDDWKISSRLTLNLGFRYELPLPLTEKYGRLTNFVPALNKLVIGSTAQVAPGVTFTNASQVETAQQAGLPQSLIQPDYKDFAPRFGLAWRPFDGNRTVVRGGYGIFYGSAGVVINMYSAAAVIFPFSITQTINRTAVPTYLTLSNPFPVAPNLAGASTAVAGFQTPALSPYAQNWNFIVEQALSGTMALEIGYTGSKGTHLPRSYGLNQPHDRSPALPAGITPYPQWGTITYFCYCFDSSYHALTATLRRRFARDFFYRVNYSYSKSIDDGSVLQGGGAGGYAGLQDARNRALERGRSDLDMPHKFSTSFSWVVPHGAGASWSHVLTRGWQLAGSGIAHTGAPFTPQVSNVNLNLGQANRPNRIAKGTLPNPTVNHWFNLAAFPQIPLNGFGFGNSGRNILDAPGLIAINLALYRNFTIHEKSNLQFRWEVFNALNHTNFTPSTQGTDPVVYVNAPNAGTLTQAGASRQMQVALRYSF
jgi:hypothetical protein